MLHSLFWDDLAPKGKAADRPVGLLATAIDMESAVRAFKKEFTRR